QDQGPELLAETKYARLVPANRVLDSAWRRSGVGSAPVEQRGRTVPAEWTGLLEDNSQRPLSVHRIHICCPAEMKARARSCARRRRNGHKMVYRAPRGPVHEQRVGKKRPDLSHFQSPGDS